MTAELLEKLCVAWWELEKDGKRVAGCSWEETKPEWRAFYSDRILKVIETYEKETK